MRRLRAALALVTAVPSVAQTPAPAARLTLLSPAEATGAGAAIDRAALPSGAREIKVERRQIARLTADRQPELWFVPVTFLHGERSEMFPDTPVFRSRCGVFVMAAGGAAQYFLYTISDTQDLAVDQCGGLKAIARAGGGLHPELKLSYRTFSPPRQEDTVQVQLLWDQASGRYKVGRASD